MINFPSIPLPADAGSLSGIGRVIRQICLLREQADAAAATRLQETELAAAVHEFRARHGSDAITENGLQAMFVTEEQRVADAVILSELLIPRLVGNVPATSRPAPPAARTTSDSDGATRPSVPDPARGAPAIPDLLDAMLAAERTSLRTRR